MGTVTVTAAKGAPKRPIQLGSKCIKCDDLCPSVRTGEKYERNSFVKETRMPAGFLLIISHDIA